MSRSKTDMVTYQASAHALSCGNTGLSSRCCKFFCTEHKGFQLTILNQIISKSTK